MPLVHLPSMCEGEPCAIHNPSHHMADFPWTIRWDRGAMVERRCPHGVGHPDPDSVRWLESHGRDIGGDIHGCCAERCCVPPQMEKETAVTDVPAEYLGVPVPGRLRPYWDKPTGRWWRMGVDAKAARVPFQVMPGQVYLDNDYRSWRSGRTLRVDRITDDGVYAICTVLTNYDRVQNSLDFGWNIYKDMRGSETAIKVRRLYPNARGYALIQDVSREAA